MSEGRVPPHSLAAERGVLGSMLIEQEAVAVGTSTLLPEDFYREAHATIFRAMLALSDRGEPVDYTTMQDELAKAGKLDAIGGVAYLIGLANETVTAAHAQRYADKVRERSAARRLIRVGTEIVARGFDPMLTAEDMLNEADTAIQSARTSTGSAEVEKAGDIATRQMLHVWSMGEDATPASGFGLRIDQHLRNGKRTGGVFRGFRPGDLTIIGGRTSMGKTAVVLHVARQCAVEMQRPVLIATLEMLEEDVIDRLFSSLSGIPADLLASREAWASADMGLLKYATETIDHAPIYVTQKHRTTTQIKAAALAVQRKAGLGLVIVDYMELIQDAIAGEKRDQLGKIVQRLRSMALEMHVPVVAVHQLNRAPDARQDKRPFLSDLRDSGHLENAADAVILLYRPGYYDVEADQSELEIIVAKQRKGDVGMTRVRLNRECGTLADYETSEPPPDRTTGRRRAEEREP